MTRDELLRIPIDDCHFGKAMNSRVQRRLDELGIKTIGDLVEADHARLSEARGWGQKAFDAVNDFLQTIGERPKVDMKCWKKRSRMLSAEQLAAELKEKK